MTELQIEEIALRKRLPGPLSDTAMRSALEFEKEAWATGFGAKLPFKFRQRSKFWMGLGTRSCLKQEDGAGGVRTLLVRSACIRPGARYGSENSGGCYLTTYVVLLAIK